MSCYMMETNSCFYVKNLVKCFLLQCIIIVHTTRSTMYLYSPFTIIDGTFFGAKAIPHLSLKKVNLEIIMYVMYS